MNLSVIILAAGAGTRMRSLKPKVLHEIAGLPMIEHVYNTSKKLTAKDIQIVYGHGAELLQQQCQHFDVQWAMQAEQLGTAHAVKQASPQINEDDVVLILYGDVPLIKAETLKILIAKVTAKNISLLTVELDNPTGYGRIVRANGEVTKIVEHKDATDEIKKIKEVNTGILAVKSAYLNACLERVDNKNSQKEYYLTDIIALAVSDGSEIKTTQARQHYEVAGINDRMQLAQLERIQQKQLAQQVMLTGVTLADPERIDIRGKLSIGTDSYIDINCIFEGKVNIGMGVSIGAGCIIKNSTIASGCILKPYSIIENTIIEKNSEVGPFSRLRPSTYLEENTRVGNFVEIKKTRLGKNSKAGHLSYLGDSEIGKNVNIGAGTITCNYDGSNKHKTIIKDGAFIGSDTQLVAPVCIGQNAVIGAGSTITKDAEEGALTLSRAQQKTIKTWKKTKK